MAYWAKRSKADVFITSQEVAALGLSDTAVGNTTLPVFITEDADGLTRGSVAAASSELARQDLAHLAESNTIINAVVAEVIRGGLLVSLAPTSQWPSMKQTALLPAQLVDCNRTSDLGAYVGRDHRRKRR